MRIGRPFLFLLLALSACGGRTRQADPGARFGASAGPPPPTVQSLQVVALTDKSMRAAPQYRDRIGQVLDHASDLLVARVGVALDVARIEPAEALAGDPLEALEAAAPAPEADLVVLFTARRPPVRARMPDLAQSRYAGRYAVIYALGRWFPTDRRRLHDAEVRSVLHAVGRVLGALPTCEPSISTGDLGFLSDDPASWRFSGRDLALMRAHATLDLRTRAAHVPADVGARALALLGETDACDLSAVAARRELLQTVAATAPKPQPQDGAVQQGLAALKDGKAAEALALCEPVARRSPADDAARCAGLAAAALDQHAKAVEALRAHLALDPEDIDTELVLARQVGLSGDDGAARALLQRVVERRPDHAQAGINLGVAHARLGELDEAAAAWRAVLARHPENADAKQLLEQLEAARRQP